MFAIAVRVSSGNKRVVGPRVDDLRPQPVMQQLAQAQRHIQHHILLLNPLRAQRPRVMPAMPGIDHDPPNLQPQVPASACSAHLPWEAAGRPVCPFPQP